MTWLREALNVDDLKKRDRIVRRLRRLRADTVLDKNTIEHWNRLHPNERQLSTAFEDRVIAWCDDPSGPPPHPSAFPVFKDGGS